jgi:hypothetical protein
MTGSVTDRVRAVIARTSRTQVEFATSIGLEPTKLSKALSGVRRFTSLELALIAEQGEVTVDWLLNGGSAEAPSMAARARPDVSADATATAVDRAEHLDELHISLVELGFDQVLPALSGRPRSGRHVDQGRRLASRALAMVDDAGCFDDLVRDLPSVLEQVFGVDVAIEELGGGFDGLAWVRGSFRLALVSNATSWSRQRFTLAHELGHVLAGDADGSPLRVDRDVMSTTGDPQAEMRANAFAAAFLMPEPTLRARVDGLLSDDDFARLVGELRVSPAALAWRLLGLGLVDAAHRAELGATPARAAALHGGWADELRSLETTQRVTRPPMCLLARALRAYDCGATSVRPVAAILGRSPDEVLDALEEHADAGTDEVTFDP